MLSPFPSLSPSLPPLSHTQGCTAIDGVALAAIGRYCTAMRSLNLWGCARIDVRPSVLPMRRPISARGGKEDALAASWLSPYVEFPDVNLVPAAWAWLV